MKEKEEKEEEQEEEEKEKKEEEEEEQRGGEEEEGGETSNVWIGVDRRGENWRSLNLAIPRQRGSGKETWRSKLAGN